MSLEECLEQLSLLRLGALTGLLPLPEGAAGAMRLLINAGDGHLEAAKGQPLAVAEAEAARAAMLRNALNREACP
jgi:protein-arginine kinase